MKCLAHTARCPTRCTQRKRELLSWKQERRCVTIQAPLRWPSSGGSGALHGRYAIIAMSYLKSTESQSFCDTQKTVLLTTLTLHLILTLPSILPSYRSPGDIKNYLQEKALQSIRHHTTSNSDSSTLHNPMLTAVSIKTDKMLHISWFSSGNILAFVWFIFLKVPSYTVEDVYVAWDVHNHDVRSLILKCVSSHSIFACHFFRMTSKTKKQ